MNNLKIKKWIITCLLLILICQLFSLSSCIPAPKLIGSVEVHAVNNCGSYYTNANVVIFSKGLRIGRTYEIKVKGGALTAWSDGHAWFYSLQVTYRSQITNEMVTIKVGDGKMYKTAEEAELVNIGKSRITDHLAEAKIYFWISDPYCDDNSGLLHAEIRAYF